MEKTINAAVREAQETLHYDEVPFISVLGQHLRNNNVNMCKFTLFAYILPEQLSLSISRAFYPSYQLPALVYALLPVIQRNKLVLHNLETQQVLETSNFQDLPRRAVFCVAEKSKVLCIGGIKPPTKKTYWLDLCSKEIAAAANLNAEKALQM